MSIDTLSTNVERRTGRKDRYIIEQGKEKTSPSLVSAARAVHAQGYMDMGFVREGYLALDGSLPADIDKARGKNVDYFLATSYESNDDEDSEEATVRVINIPKGGSLSDLPAYNLCKDTLDDECRGWLESIENPEKCIKEIAALAKKPNTSPLAIFEVLRDPFHSALGKNEVWFFSIVSSTFASLQENFGEYAIKQVGEPISFDDERINPNLTLIPAIVEVDEFINQIAASAIVEKDERKQRVLSRSFMFYAESVPDSMLNEDAVGLRDFIRDLMSHKEG